MTGYGQIRSTVPKHVWPGPYYFSNAGVAGLDSECKYIAMLPAPKICYTGINIGLIYQGFETKYNINSQIQTESVKVA